MTTAATLDRNTRLRRADVTASDVHGEMVMIDAARGAYFGLDAIGSDIWSRLDQGRSAADLAAELAKDYDASPEEIERDLLVLFSALLENGLVLPA